MEDLQLDNLGVESSFNYVKQKEQQNKYGKILIPQNPLNFDLDLDFEEAEIKDPSQFCHALKNADGPERKIMNFNKGTTTLGFVFKEGVLLAVDSRASQGTFDASETVRKIIEINDFLLGTMAGGAADCLFWEQQLAVECRKYQLKHGQKVTVAAASRILINILYYYRQHGLSMGCMLAGYDKSGGNLYYLDDDGARVKGNIFSIGSGSTYAYGVLDTYYKFDMSLKDAVELGKRAIYHATYRDAGSGGVCRVYHCHKDGWTKIEEGLDVNELHYQFAKEKGLNGLGDETNQSLL